jgi:hypothetical protein
MQLDRFHGVERHIRSQDMRKHHTREQRLEALNELLKRAYPMTFAPGPSDKAIFHLPPQDDDADVILYQAIDELEEHGSGGTKAYIATITGGSYGLNDFPNGRPGIWFGVKYGLYGMSGAGVHFMGDDAEEFMIRHNIGDIRKIDGRKCVVVEDKGIVHFIGMLQLEGRV